MLKCHVRRIGIFGGSFNPIHAGHIRIALKAVRDYALDRVLVIPAKTSPFKVGRSGAAVLGGVDDATRWRLVCAACADYPALEPDNAELRRGGISYAIDTVRAVRRRFPGAEIYFIVGADSVAGLPRWKDWPTLKKLAHFAAYPRTRESSTEVRARLASGRALGALVPPPVAAILKGLFHKTRVTVTGTVPPDFGITKAQVRAAAERFAAASRSRIAADMPWHEVTVHLVRDAASDACHRAIMNVAGATDVITQAYDAIPPEEPGLYGELFVNTDQARRAAPKRRGWSVARELLLYVAHGMDHLSGADDHAPADYARMRRRELTWLRQLDATAVADITPGRRNSVSEARA